MILAEKDGIDELAQKHTLCYIFFLLNFGCFSNFTLVLISLYHEKIFYIFDRKCSRCTESTNKQKHTVGLKTIS